jgi:hypothetical protein
MKSKLQNSYTRHVSFIELHLALEMQSIMVW